MYDDYPPGCAQVGVGVPRRRRAMRRPTGMADSRRSADRGTVYQFRQARQFARIAPDLNLASVKDGQPGRVIAPVFQAFESIKDDWRRVLRADISDDSTHNRDPPFLVIG